MNYLCDTNILSELSRPRPNPGVQAWAERLPGVYLSAVTVEEVLFGLAWRPNQRVLAWFEDFLADFCEIVPADEAIARDAGELRGRLMRQGAVRTQADMLIAAAARQRGLILVTRNVRDFAGCGIQVLNPFSK